MSQPVTLPLGDYDDAGQYWDAATRYLAARMSELSEDAWCASWHVGLERIIWDVGQTSTSDGWLDEVACRSLVNLARELGCWWVWPDGTSGPQRITLVDWVRTLAADALEPRGGS